MDEDDCYCDECGGKMLHRAWGHARCKDCREGDIVRGKENEWRWWLWEEDEE